MIKVNLNSHYSVIFFSFQCFDVYLLELLEVIKAILESKNDETFINESVADRNEIVFNERPSLSVH